jgi:hypothetical protein
MQNPKAKKDSRCLFSLSEYARVKAACKKVCEIDPCYFKKEFVAAGKAGL